MRETYLKLGWSVARRAVKDFQHPVLPKNLSFTWVAWTLTRALLPRTAEEPAEPVTGIDARPRPPHSLDIFDGKSGRRPAFPVLRRVGRGAGREGRDLRSLALLPESILHILCEAKCIIDFCFKPTLF